MKMVKKIKRNTWLFLRMPFKRKTMLIANLFLCGMARAAVKTIPLPYLARYFGQFNKTITISQLISRQQIHQAFQMGRSIRLAAKYTPWDSSCLTQAIVAKFWCSLFKIPYAFYIGFAKSENAPSGYNGHAWVTAGPVAITGGHSFLDYHIVSSYFSTYAQACNEAAFSRVKD